MTLAHEYEDFLLEMAKFFQAAGFTTSDMLMKVSEENGEVAEAWVMSRGLKSWKGTAREFDVASELADLAMAAMTTIVHLGFQPSHMLEEQEKKMRERFLDNPS